MADKDNKKVNAATPTVYSFSSAENGYVTRSRVTGYMYSFSKYSASIKLKENGSFIYVTAYAKNSNYAFDYWSSSGNSYTAHFKQVSVNVSVYTNNSSAGYVTGGGSVAVHGYTYVNAYPYDYYYFSKWSDGSTQRTSHLVAVKESDVSITAYFYKNQYTVQYFGNGGTIGSGYETQTDVWDHMLYNYESTNVVKRDGYRCKGWYDTYYSGNKVERIPKYNEKVWAQWIKQWTVKAAVWKSSSPECGEGSVSIDGNVGREGATVSKTVDEGTTVTISATPAPYCKFKYWSDDFSAPITRTVTINSDKTYTAVFERYHADVKLWNDDGSLSQTMTWYAGKPIKETCGIPPNKSGTRRIFNGFFSLSGEQYYDRYGKSTGKYWTSKDTTFELYAQFINVYKIDLLRLKEPAIAIYNLEGVGWYSDSYCTNIITMIPSIPEVEDNHRFDGYKNQWDVKTVDRQGCILASYSSISSDQTWYYLQVEVANITIEVEDDAKGRLYITSEKDGEIRTKGKRAYDLGDTITVIVNRNWGWECKGWTRNGAEWAEGEGKNHKIYINVDRNERGTRYTARFKIVTFTVQTDTIYQQAYGKVLIDGSNVSSKVYQEGAYCTLSILYNDWRYGLQSWAKRLKTDTTGSWDKISGATNDTYTFQVFELSSSYKYSAYFEKQLYHIQIINLCEDLGTTYGSGWYKPTEKTGKKVELTATPKEGSSFLGWFEKRDSTTPKYRYSPWKYEVKAKDVTLYAKFKLKVNVVTRPYGSKYKDIFKVKKNTTDEGDENSCYDYDGWFSYTAIEPDPKKGRFKYWIVNGERFSDGYDPTQCYFRVKKNSTVKAVFQSLVGEYTVLVSSTQPLHADCIGSGKYDKGEIVWIECCPKDKYTFKYWIEDGNKYRSRGISVTGNMSFTAQLSEGPEGDFEERENDWGINESVWYLPKTNSHGLKHIQLGYNDYSNYELNPITNYVYRLERPESSIGIINSNCTWYGAGRVMEISNREYMGCTGMAGDRWFALAYTNVDGEYWDREGFSDYYNHKGYEIDEIYRGDILCWDNHIDIVENIDYNARKIKVSYGWYKYFHYDVTNETRCETCWINWPKVGDTSSGERNWGNVCFQGVIHNPNLSWGGMLKTIRVYPTPSDAGEAYVNGTDHYSGKVGDEVILSYTENEGHHFTKWSDGNTKNYRKYKLTKSESIYAYFDDFNPNKQVCIYADINPAGYGEVIIDGGSVHKKGENVTMTYVLNEEALNFEFVGWSDTGSTENPHTIYNVQETMHITAKFNNGESPEPAPIQNYELIPGDGGDIEVKKLEFNIGAYKIVDGSEREYISPSLKVYIDGKLYKTIPETSYKTTTIEFSPSVKTSDIKIVLNGDYSDRNSIVFNSLLIEYYGWDEDYGEHIYTRYYDGSKWTQWVKET